MIYLICFSLSAFFAYLAKKSKSRTNFIFFSILSVAVTAVLAGLRGISVGIDTSNYYYGSWSRVALYPSIFQYFERYYIHSNNRFEVLYILFIGVIQKTTDNYQVYLLMIHIIIVSGVYIGAFRMRKHADPVFTLLLFYLLYYNHSLNISRQYVSMAIIFAATADIEEAKIKRYLLFVAIAFLFHNTGILGLMPLLIYLVLYPQNRLQNVSFNRRLVIGALIIAAPYAFIPLVRMLLRRGLLSSHYSGYLLAEEAAIPKIVILLVIIEAVCLLMWGKGIRRYDSRGDFFIFCSVSFILLYQLATMILYGKRIAAYFSFLNIITLGLLPESQKSYYQNKRILRIGVFLLVFAYWLYFYAYKNSSHTFPYVLGV